MKVFNHFFYIALIIISLQLNLLVEKYAPEKVCLLLVGNKADRAEKVVSSERALKFAESKKIPYLECSAKSNTNIDECFQTLATALVECRDDSGNEKVKNDRIKLLTQNFVSTMNRCC